METGRFRDRRRRTMARGFTFIEIMIALVICSLLLTAALPAYRDWIAAQQLATHAYFIADTLDLVRSEASTAIASTCARPVTGASVPTSAVGSRVVTVRR